MTRKWPLIWVCAALWLSGVSEHALGDDGGHTTADVLASWKKRREAVSTIDYVVTGEGRIPKGSLTNFIADVSDLRLAEFPPEDRIFPVRLRFVARIRDKKLRLERQIDYPRVTRKGPPTFVTDYRTYLFDGTKGFLHIPDERYDAATSVYPQLQPAEDVMVSLFIESMHHPFLLAHGFVPVALRNITMDDLAGPPIDIPYSLVDSKPRVGDGLLVLRSKPLGGELTFEIWVDPKRDYVITRIVLNKESATLETTDLNYEADGDDWALTSWRFAKWGNNGMERSYQLKIRSTKLNDDLPDELFAPPTETKLRPASDTEKQ